ncbi:MAG: Asp-tRNA(Asn)/Glu-tRNA(Gln) amidotransferase subunit GatC [Solirubrobacterales bacterium]
MIDRDQVVHVARLARLELGEDEVGALAEELSSIIDHVDRLLAVDTDGVEPTTHVVPLENVLRDDVPGEELTPEQALAPAPSTEDGAFLVPSPKTEG